MKIKNLKFLLFLLLILSCQAYKNKISSEGGKNQAIEIAILDFIKTNKLSKKDSVFRVKIYDPLFRKKLIEKSSNEYSWENEKPYDNLIVVNIFGIDYKNQYLIKDGQLIDEDIPSRHYEMKNRLFIWDDKDIYPDKKTIDALTKYGLVTNDKRDTIQKIDDSKKGTDYYFCKKKLTKFKKLRKSVAAGYYDAPKINCE